MINGTHAFGESSSNTSVSNQEDIEDDRMIAVVLSEEYANLDNSIGRRLSNLAPLPHVPRINSYIPNFSDASLDHQRLLQRLNVYGLYEVKVSGDGNCQFRALSDQMYKSPEHHKHVRKEIVKQLKDCRSLYESYVPMNYKKYYKKMAKSGEWGDHVTLQAAADKFGAKVCLLTSFRETCFIEIHPQGQSPQLVSSNYRGRDLFWLVHRKHIFIFTLHTFLRVVHSWCRAMVKLLVRGALQFLVPNSRCPDSAPTSEETLAVLGGGVTVCTCLCSGICRSSCCP